jgi:hypothetical protein|tara:strand:- start:38 stop:295 length:258 start_codon:yes stop_codon:yes gene_type:complete
MIKMFGKKAKAVPQSYQPVLEAKEVIGLFSRLTLHHQAALLRLISRNLVINVDGEDHMGYDFDYEVDGAVVLAKMLDDDLELPED